MGGHEGLYRVVRICGLLWAWKEEWLCSSDWGKVFMGLQGCEADVQIELVILAFA